MDDAERLAAFLAEVTARPTTWWVHVIEHDHRHKMRTASLTRGYDSTREYVQESRIKRLRATPPAAGRGTATPCTSATPTGSSG